MTTCKKYVGEIYKQHCALMNLFFKFSFIIFATQNKLQ